MAFFAIKFPQIEIKVIIGTLPGESGFESRRSCQLQLLRSDKMGNFFTGAQLQAMV